ncbi:hypothetical protein T484DRAFT_1790164, partial [Baffinella frigidus]
MAVEQRPRSALATLLAESRSVVERLPEDAAVAVLNSVLSSDSVLAAALRLEFFDDPPPALPLPSPLPSSAGASTPPVALRAELMAEARRVAEQKAAAGERGVRPLSAVSQLISEGAALLDRLPTPLRESIGDLLQAADSAVSATVRLRSDPEAGPGHPEAGLNMDARGSPLESAGREISVEELLREGEVLLEALPPHAALRLTAALGHTALRLVNARVTGHADAEANYPRGESCTEVLPIFKALLADAALRLTAALLESQEALPALIRASLSARFLLARGDGVSLTAPLDRGGRLVEDGSAGHGSVEVSELLKEAG